MKLIFIYTILLVSLFGCSTSNEEGEDLNKKSNIVNESKIEQVVLSKESNQVDDFKVSIHVEDDLNAYATITYIGDEAEKEIYHGGSIFYFNIYQQDGNFKYEGAMTLPLLSTTLIQNEPHTVTFDWIEDLDLEKGFYEFKAIADFSLDSNDVMGTKLEIPVSTSQEIK